MRELNLSKWFIISTAIFSLNTLALGIGFSAHESQKPHVDPWIAWVLLLSPFTYALMILVMIPLIVRCFRDPNVSFLSTAYVAIGFGFLILLCIVLAIISWKLSLT
jgi:hypothetical protein